MEGSGAGSVGCMWSRLKEYGGDWGITSGPLYIYRPKCPYQVDFAHPALRIPRTDRVCIKVWGGLG